MPFPEISCSHLLCIPLDGAYDSHVSVTAAQYAGHRLLDLCRSRFRVPIHEGFGCHDDAVDTEPTLHCLLIDERILNRMWFLDRPAPLERRDLRSSHGTHGRNTRANRLTSDNHRARPTLAETAPE